MNNSLKRKRSRLACKPCRERKRKCDGHNPCLACTEWGYECDYPETRRPRPKLTRPGAEPGAADGVLAASGSGAGAGAGSGGAVTGGAATGGAVTGGAVTGGAVTGGAVTGGTGGQRESPNHVLLPRTAPSPAVVPDQRGLVRQLEANSGAAFVRKLGLKIDPMKAPKLNLFGWNIGTRPLATTQLDPLVPVPVPVPVPLASSAAATAAAAAAAAATVFSPSSPPLSVVEIASLEHVRSLARVYFDKVDPCYGFIDRRQFFERLDLRWQSPPTPAALAPAVVSDYDAVLAGVAAIGCLFSQRNATVTELHLVRSARCSLDAHHLAGPPSVDLLTAWALRVVYLRETGSPHATWVASSTLMHLVEASGLHTVSSSSVLLPSASSSASAQCDPDLRGRLVGVAHHLNAWASFDLGLSRVAFQKYDDLPLPSELRPGDYTAELLGLLPVSVSLDPGRLQDDEADLPSTLSQILRRAHTQPPSVLAQCNLVLCVLRRIHTQRNLDLSSGLAEQVLALFEKALGCARAMVADCSPWHQVANVPFHIICVLLVMDTRSSFAMLPNAMQTLRFVASAYDTETTREAYSAAYLLVLLHQQRRRDDMAIFCEAFGTPTPQGHQGHQGHHGHHGHHGQRLNTPLPPLPPLPPPPLPPPPPQPLPQPNAGPEDFSWLEALVSEWPGLQGIDLDQFLNTNIE